MKNNMVEIHNEKEFIDFSQTMYSVFFDGKEYQISYTSESDDFVYLISNEPVDNSSFELNGKFYTQKFLSGIKEIVKKSIYALYNDEIYPVLLIDSILPICMLRGPDNLEEAKRKGFTVNFYKSDVPYLELKKNEINKFYVLSEIISNAKYVNNDDSNLKK